MTLFLVFLAIIALFAGIYFLMFVSKPPQRNPQKLSDRITEFTNTDTEASILQNKFKAIKTRAFIGAAKTQLEAAQTMTSLNTEYKNAVTADKTFDGRLKNELLTLENQNEILERATEYGVPVSDYTKFMLKVLESKTEIAKEAMSLRMTIDLAIARSDRHFALIKQLQQQIRSLRIELHELPQKQLPAPVQELEETDLRSQITALEARLNDHLEQTGVSRNDGKTT